MVVVAVLLAFNGARVRDRLRGQPIAFVPKIESIAVLPLQNLSGDPEQEYFADGMTEELVTNLGKLKALRVISRTSMMRYKGTKKPLPEIAKELNVDGIVEGSVRRFGNRVRITAKLLHGPTDREVWADTYESALADILIMQGEAALAIADGIRLKLTPEAEQRLARARPVDPAAHDAYLKGQFYSARGESSRGNIYIRKAIDIDPNYALAYASLAESYVQDAWSNALPPRDAFKMAKAAALKAVALDDTSEEGHAILATIKCTFDWDWDGADLEFKRAIELNPNSQTAHNGYAICLSCVRRFDEAIAQSKIAFELYPESRLGLVNVYTFAGRSDDAIREAKIELERNPALIFTRLWLSQNYLAQGKIDEAIAECQEVKRATHVPISAIYCASAYAAAGRREEAERELEVYRRGSYIDPWMMAGYHAWLGENEKAMKALLQAYEERSANLCLLNVNIAPFRDSLRSDPRFQELVRKMNFPP
jgi:adenylate cyclase